MEYFIKNEHIEVPSWFLNITYNPRIIPSERTRDLLQTGANCQVFAYELLRYNGLYVPNFRSSELWDDTVYSKQIHTDFQPLDILFFNKTADPFGAHLGVYVANDKILHNTQKAGKPVVWLFEEFFKIAEYRVFIGAKRF